MIHELRIYEAIPGKVPELNNARVMCYKTELYNPYEVVIREYSNTLKSAVSAFEQYKGAI